MGEDKFVADINGLQPSENSSWNSGGTAGILPAERAKCSFEVEKMTNFIDGGPKETFRRRWITGTTKDTTSVAGTSQKFDLPRDNTRGSVAQNFVHFMDIHKEFLDKFYIPKGREMLYMNMGSTMAGYPGFGLFVQTVAGQSSAEQLSEWLPYTYTMKITGSYSQTELGHGSNVRGLETTATYDPTTHEFVLNTPTLSSMKWWPSNLTISTHTVVYAQLIMPSGEQKGVHAFMVQVRDEELRPMAGVEIGDIGTKAGENEVDIGYLRLKDVRIPRLHMFGKKSYVSEEGKYVLNPMQGNSKTHYLTMMSARVAMVAGSSAYLAKGATIAIRYNCVRKQGFVQNSTSNHLSAENQIIEYKMNQYVLFKYLSLATATRVTSNWLSDKMSAMQQQEDFADISALHASAAGLKGYCCNAAAVGLEELRKCCGGAGYLEASGIAPLVSDYKWRATAEGDTTVMLLQTAKFLLKAVPSAAAVDALEPKSASSVERFLDLEYLVQLFEFRSAKQVLLLNETVSKKMQQGRSQDEVWSELTLKAVKTGTSHIIWFMLSKFKAMVETCADKQCQAALMRLCTLFALSDILDGNQWIGLLSLEQMQLVESACDLLCAQIRPDAVGLVDAWDFHDKSLNSTIGRYDGNIYEAQYLAAVNSPLNKKAVPDYLYIFHKYLDKDFLAAPSALADELKSKL